MSNASRIPPHSFEAEQWVLGAMMIDPQAAMAKCAKAGLERECFFDPRNRIVFDAVSEMRAAGRPIDPLTVAEALKSSGDFDNIGGYEYLEQLQMHGFVSAHMDNYCDILLEKRGYRQLINHAVDILDSCYGEDSDPLSIANSARANLSYMEAAKAKECSIHDAAEQAIEDWKRVFAGERLGIPWHVQSIASKFGTMQGGNGIFFIGGEPGAGKSAVMQGLLKHWSLGMNLPTACASIEMTKKKLVKRFVSEIADVSMWELENGSYGIGTPAQRAERGLQMIEAAKHAAEHFTLAPIDICERRMNCDEVVAYGLEQYETRGIVALGHDYFQLSGPPERKRLEGLEAIKYCLDRYADFSKKTGVAMICISQLSKIARDKNGESRIPQQDDLYGGRMLDAYSEGTTIFFSRDGRDFANIAKNRNGATGVVELFFNRKRLRHEDCGNSQPPAMAHHGADYEEGMPF